MCVCSPNESSGTPAPSTIRAIVAASTDQSDTVVAIPTSTTQPPVVVQLAPARAACDQQLEQNVLAQASGLRGGGAQPPRERRAQRSRLQLPAPVAVRSARRVHARFAAQPEHVLGLDDRQPCR